MLRSNTTFQIIGHCGQNLRSESQIFPLGRETVWWKMTELERLSWHSVFNATRISDPNKICYGMIVLSLIA